MSYIEPATIAPQADTAAAAAERRATPLTLVIEGPAGIRRYETCADQAWCFMNDPYDHAAGTFESPGASDGAYYTSR